MSLPKPASSLFFQDLDRSDKPGGVDVRRVRQAIDTAQRSLATFPETEDVRRLVRQAAGLSAEVEHWVSSPPSPDACDRVMRSVMAIHIGTVEVARTVRGGRAIGKA
jgi:hypothetical protein